MVLFSRKKEDTYFAELCGDVDPTLASRIQQAISTAGLWEESEEWRISTVTEMSVKPVESKGRVWFEVSVKCDHEFVCHAPTVERAAQFVWLYKTLIVKLFYQLGWPSRISQTEHPNANT